MTEAGIQYLNYRFRIVFETPINFHTFPTFIFRSILGNQLKRMSCIMRGKSCDECPLRYQCSYSVIFETPVPKDNPHLSGRNRYPHPFTLYLNAGTNTATTETELDLNLFGSNISYFPYLYFALKQAGEAGVFKERIRYKIESITANGKNILISTENLDTEINPSKWLYPETESESVYRKLIIELLSPLRLKINGHYSKNFSYTDFIENLQRRLTLLCKSYGNCGESSPQPNSESPKTEKIHLQWADYPRYSARQKTALRLGGVIGLMEIEGEFSAAENAILQGGSIFHCGKNTAFGFGKISIREKG